MRFNFKMVGDGQEFTAPRPVFQLVIEGSTRSRPCYCLLDTGTPDVLVMADLAEDAGIDLTEAEPIGEFPLEGGLCTGRRVEATCIALDGNEELALPDMPVIFVTSWPTKRQFGGILGTHGMEHIRVTVSVRQQWFDLSAEASFLRSDQEASTAKCQ
jgi:hypothetical protein